MEAAQWLRPGLLVAGIALVAVSLVLDDGRAGAVTAVACLVLGLSLSRSVRLLLRLRGRRYRKPASPSAP